MKNIYILIILGFINLSINTQSIAEYNSYYAYFKNQNIKTLKTTNPSKLFENYIAVSKDAYSEAGEDQFDIELSRYLRTNQKDLNLKFCDQTYKILSEINKLMMLCAGGGTGFGHEQNRINAISIYIVNQITTKNKDYSIGDFMDKISKIAPDTEGLDLVKIREQKKIVKDKIGKIENDNVLLFKSIASYYMENY